MAGDRLLLVVVATLVVVAGCSVVDTGAGGGDDRSAESPDGAGEVTTLVPAGSLVGDATGIEATVVDVVDGDTLDVRYPDGTIDTVRLLGIDTPEVRGTTDPAEFEGVPDSDAGRDCLRAAGDDASAALTARLSGADVRLVVDPQSDRRDRYDRLLAYVVHDGRNVDYWLVASGHARVYDSTFRYAEQFYAAERAARERGAGVWRCRDPEGSTTWTSDVAPLALVEIHADAAGNDHRNLVDEYVVFRNVGENPLDVGGWTVTDAASHAYTFPADTIIVAGARLTLHSGAGTDGDGHVYWVSDTAVWNNDGDTITVTDADGRPVLSVSY